MGKLRRISRLIKVYPGSPSILISTESAVYLLRQGASYWTFLASASGLNPLTLQRESDSPLAISAVLQPPKNPARDLTLWTKQI